MDGGRAVRDGRADAPATGSPGAPGRSTGAAPSAGEPSPVPASEAGAPGRAPAVRLSARERGRAVERVLWITLVLNLMAAAIKLAGGLSSGAISLVAGGADSISDGAANLVGLLAARAASRPPDENHPYGHRKIETMVAVVIAALLLATGARVAWGAASRLIAGAEPPDVDLATLAAPAVALLLNLAASTYEARQGRRLGSEMLVADAAHTRADVGVTLALVVGLAAVRAGYPIVDPLLALAIAGVIAWVGVRVALEAYEVLSDVRPVDASELVSHALAVPGVIGAHKARSRGPRDSVAVDLHVQVDPTLGVGRSHAIAHEVTERLKAEVEGVVDVVVHVEPDWQARDADVAAAVRRVLSRFPVDAHELHVHGGERVEVGVHLELDPELSLSRAHDLATSVEAAVLAEVPDVTRLVTHLEPRGGGHETARAPVDGRDYPALVEQAVADVPGLGEAHDVEAVHVEHGVRLSAHVRAPGDMSIGEAHARTERLEAVLRGLAPELERVTLHLEPIDCGVAGATT